MNNLIAPHQDTYYDHENNRYWKEMSPGRWVKLDQNSLWKHLMASMPPVQGIASIVNDMILEIQRDHHVDFAGNLAGSPAGLCIQGDTRILIRSGPKFIDPIPGAWSMLQGVLENMFGGEQLPYVYGWIKKSLEMFHSSKWMAGQVLVLCGEPGVSRSPEFGPRVKL
ncbi:MAG: hypothetical protein ABIS50_09340 [Luteolibacter sp.]|uniref:hypothetical protein n=1 Tax=Luteolibacter sp. TaxID=1962973 RepID=UPI003266EB1F